VIQTFNQNDGLHDVNITALAQDHQGSLWIGALSGLSQFDPNSINSSNEHSIANNHSENQRFRHFDHRHGLSLDRIASLFVDYENNLWAGTWAAASTS
jgi:ligand-binding sensor domain-containing protein